MLRTQTVVFVQKWSSGPMPCKCSTFLLRFVKGHTCVPLALVRLPALAETFAHTTTIRTTSVRHQHAGDCSVFRCALRAHTGQRFIPLSCACGGQPPHSRPEHVAKLLSSTHLNMGVPGMEPARVARGVPPSETDNFRSSLVLGVWPNSLELAFA